MINIVIYLKKEQNPVLLVEKLLINKLIANASIDENNESYTIKEGKLIKEIYSVITAKTKSLLFTEIAEFVQKTIGTDVLINSVPIVASNSVFNELISSKIIKV